MNLKAIKRIFNGMLKGMNYDFLDFKVWLPGIYGYLNGIRSLIYKMTINYYFDYFILLCVCANTIVMALEGMVLNPDGILIMENISTIFTFLFLAEAILKLISLGITNYVRDKINIFDVFLVTISLVEYFSS